MRGPFFVGPFGKRNYDGGRLHLLGTRNPVGQRQIGGAR
jgi:hypothetical protein